jgi:hypothetical protein
MRSLWITLIASFFASAAFPQSHGYLFIAPGRASLGFIDVNLLHAGVGGEGVFKGGIGIGGDVGIIGRTDLGALGAFSLNGFYHFARHRKVDVFVTGGYSNFFNVDSHLNLANVGGGVNLWFARHFGVKFDFRDHFRTSSGTINYAEIRIGIAFK